jgi:HPt (histidine-containing phosphotransfer) domain-containing protein
MPEPADHDFLRSIFLMEAWETVAALEDGVEAVARGQLDDLFVVTHRLKGAASLHGFPDVAHLASELERLLEATPTDLTRLGALLSDLKRTLDSVAGRTPPALPAAPDRARPDVELSRVIDDPVRRELDEFFAANADVASYFVP